jgi:hypothetical protein
MGGKSSTSTQQVQIPPDVLARYNSVNTTAQQAASAPFTQYSTDPNAFVAPLNSTQNAGVANANAAANQAQPYYAAATGQLQDAQSLGAGMTGSAQTDLLNAKTAANGYNTNAGNYYTGAYNSAQPYNSTAGQLIAGGLGAAQPLNQQAQSGYSSALAGAQPYNQAATGLAAASGQAVNPTTLDSSAINQYLSPYLQTVLGSTSSLLNQNNQQAMSGQTGSAISQGAFGGDRAGVAAANLAQQQQLANANIYSGILNTGYNNALGAAQQQQGVGLSAAQANRAALGSASSQLANIGQQQYAQGTGTAAQQAALGQQEYSQGLGASSAVQGLGQQVFGQGSTTGQNTQGLGQQVFGQGLATSQQEAALAQQEYGMGANTSQQLAGLGAGAQTAAEQGAQGQLAAGQVGQQTQQAGDTALYNQFLQQQSYPFQTAQFLANIAEGTGSLSGSTTTTTQPGGFFSDKRLKDDVKEVGRTFDGQPIVTYKYKGDDKTRMGLIAQDVEKKHPDAVGRALGYRTVDYGKATEDAANRGKFASGGTPLLPGLSPADMQELLAQQASAPYAGGSGLYGQNTSAVRGGSSYVPQANLPVSHLTVAPGLAKSAAPMDSVKQAVDIASKASDVANSKYGKKAIDWVKGLGAANDDSSNDNSDDGEKRGGLVRAKRYASGGMPYDEQTGLDIPDETPSAKLAAPDSSPDKPKSGLDDAMEVAKIAAMVAGMKRGGRTKFADGGDVPDLAYVDGVDGGDKVKLDPMNTIMKGIVGLAKNRAGGSLPMAAAQTLMAAGRDSGAIKPDAGVIGAPSSVSASPDSTDYSPAQVSWLKDHGATQAAPAPRPRALAAAASGPPAWSQNGTPIDEQTAPALASAGLDTQPENMNPQGVSDSVPQTVAQPGLASRIGSGIGDAVGDYAKGLGKGNSQEWLPLLAAIGAAGTAPTVHPGVALAAGLSAGAQSYMNTKKSLADIAQTQALTGQTQAHTTTAQQGNAINYARQEMLGLLRKDPGGPIVDPETGIHYSNTQTAGPTAALATGFKYLGPTAQSVLPASSQQFIKDSPGIGITPNTGNIETSQKTMGDVYHAASDAQSNLSLLNEQAGAILSQAKGGVLSQGAMAPVFQPYVEKWNSLVTDAGHPELVVAGLGDAQIAHKLQVGQAIAQTTSAGQHAHDALSDVAAATANNALDPHAAAVLMAQNAVQATKSIDQRNALEEAKQHSPNGNYEAQDIMAAFDHDNPPTVYNAMRDRVAGIYESPAYGKIHSALSKPGTPEYQTTVKTLDAFGVQHGIPHFSRVFTGG